MLTRLCRSKPSNLRKKFAKPPVIMKMPDSYFVKPRQELADAVPPFQRDLDDHISDLLKRVNMNYNHSKKENTALSQLKPIEFYSSINTNIEYDKETGIMSGIGLEEEIKAQKSRLTAGSMENSFLNNLDSLVAKLNCLNIYELLEFYKHSVALRTAKDVDQRVKGELLNIATKEVMESLNNHDGLSVNDLTDKLALKVVYNKVESILTNQKEKTSHRYNKIIDSILNDPQIQISDAIGKDLLDAIYTISQPDLDRNIKQTYADKLNKPYARRKLEILSAFTDLPLDSDIKINTDKLEFKYRFIQSVLNKNTFVEGDDFNQQQLTMKLKDILGYNEIVDSIDSKLANLERRLDLTELRLPTLKSIRDQLNILCHTLPEDVKERFNLSKPFQARYLNAKFNSTNLQWKNVDLLIPADIMPVKEHIELEENKRGKKYLESIMPEYIPNMDTKVSRAFRDEELYADTPELDKNLDVEIEEEEKISNIRLKLGEFENEITGKVVNVDESQLDLDYSYGEEVDLKVSQPPKPDYDPLDKNLKIDYRKEVLKKVKKNRKLTNLFGKRPRTDINTLKNYEYVNGVYYNQHEPLDDDPLDKRMIEDIVNLETFEREEFFEVIRNEYSKFEIAETFNQNIKPSIFDYLVKTPEVEKVNSSQLDETSQRAIDVYREINGSLFHKHYLSKLFKMQQMDNPAQINEMLDPLDDPNFGIMRTNTVDNFVKFGTKEREDFVPDIVKEKEPNKMYYEGVMPTYFGSGSRKRSKAFAIVELNGTGNVTINDRHFIEYFNDAKYRSHILKSVVAIGKTCEVNLKVYVHGSGHSSQADAVLVAISNALIKAFPEYEKFLVDRYFTFIDTRRVERKKTSKYKARKSYTYVRR